MFLHRFFRPSNGIWRRGDSQPGNREKERERERETGREREMTEREREGKRARESESERDHLEMSRRNSNENKNEPRRLDCCVIELGNFFFYESFGARAAQQQKYMLNAVNCTAMRLHITQAMFQQNLNSKCQE